MQLLLMTLCRKQIETASSKQGEKLNHIKSVTAGLDDAEAALKEK